jgi:hypothetical protein
MLVYDQLPPDVLAELKKRLPSDKKYNRSVKRHQGLTEDY